MVTAEQDESLISIIWQKRACLMSRYCF